MINKVELLEMINPVVDQIAKELGLVALETAFVRESGQYFLRIFIYNPQKPVDHEDCCLVSRRVSQTLDEMNIPDVPYSLEVSSPGVNRKLKTPVDYDVFRNKLVKVVLKKPKEGNLSDSVLLGKLIGLSEDGEAVLVEAAGQHYTFRLASVKSVQLDG